ncbi:MAG: alpha/beta hydrolase [Chloroflexota bacterium]|nr:alpha/beta hydrolase [Chloroflexota bacterium]
MPFIDTVTGARLFYEEAGDPNAPPFIVLHGLMGTGRAHLSRLMDWLSQTNAVPPADADYSVPPAPFAPFHVIAPTLRGFGLSEPKPRDFPPNFYLRDANDVLAFMDKLDIESAHFFGYSDGGETALAAAGLAPDRCLSVTTVGAVGFFGDDLRAVIQGMFPGTWIKDDERERNQITDVDAFALAWMHGFKAMIDAGGDVSLNNAHRIACPLLILLGRQDTLNPETHGQRFAARAQQGRVAMFETGHAIHDEDWDGFRRVVGAFLKEVLRGEVKKLLK